jgi:soluble P-type ATPase
MDLPGIDISIPHFAEPLRIERIVTDYTGTLSFDGKLIAGVPARLRKLKKLVEIHVVTADTRGTARKQLARVSLTPHILKSGTRHDIQKRNYVKKLKPLRVAAFGNGNNDALLLKTVRDAGGLAIAVDNGEGCSVQAMQNANVFIVGIVNALDLLLDPARCIATLRK